MTFHLVGIGGTGMSALAIFLKERGHIVTGSDRNLNTPTIEYLRKLGIGCFPDDGKAIADDIDRVVVSSAIEDDNRDTIAAKRLSVPIVHRTEALAMQLANSSIIAVAGTCGKSTATAILAHILTECGLDPTCINGAPVPGPGWLGPVRIGKDSRDIVVMEVDESDKSLLRFFPHSVIITNSSSDHYSKDEMDKVFDEFAARVPNYGFLVDGRRKDGITPEIEEMASHIALLGAHNRENAINATRMALKWGCKKEQIIKALETFPGVARRLQRITPSNAQIAVYDDYAHNTEKLHAMWTTLANEYPKGICVVWRPHGYAPLRKLLDNLAEMFRETIRPQDELLLLPVYDAGGTADRTINSADLQQKIGLENVRLVPDPTSAADWIAANKEYFGCFATCGARDPYLPALAQEICRRIES